MAHMRYIVRDVDAAVAFYRDLFKFELKEQFGSAMAIVMRDDLTLWLAGPPSSAAQAMPDGRRPEPGGWNRIVLQVGDIEASVARLKGRGIRFRNDIVTGPAGRQILCDDPSGNCIELFQPA
jgi:predicted enzyme related to lactoylglutathione lyase